MRVVLYRNGDPIDVYNNMSKEGQPYYGTDPGRIVIDLDYKIRNNGFRAYEFFTYEFNNPRMRGQEDGVGADYPSDAEMFGLAGYTGRREFLEDFHEHMVSTSSARGY